MREIDLSALIDKRPLGRLQWLVLCLCSGVALLDGFDVQIIAFAGPPLSRELGIPGAQLGVVFSVGLVGMAAGLLLLGPLADRYGRKRIIEFSVLLFGLCTLLTAYVTGFGQVLLLRFLAGFGLGGALANVIVLMTEFAPRRLHYATVAAVSLGFSVGGMLIGTLAARFIPVFGWRGLFVLGGVLPMLMVVLLLRWLPESIRYLKVCGSPRRATLDTLLRRMYPDSDYGADVRLTLGEPDEDAGPRVSVRRLFEPGYVADTLRLWVLFFINLLTMYTLLTWIPSLLVNVGYHFEQAAAASVYFNLGGALGPFVLAWLIARPGSRDTLAGFFLLGSVSTLLIGQFGTWPGMVLALTFLAGLFVFGIQTGINVLTTSIYPTVVRSTGLGWALGIGRVGTVLGPLVTGVLVQLEFGMPVYFGVFGALLAVAAATCATFRRV